LKELKSRATELDAAVEALYLRIPNIPHASVPEGGEEANQIVRTWGEPRRPDHAVMPHWDIGSELGLFELERGARMSGSGFTALRGDGARLEWALINWFLDQARERGYVQVVVPYLVNRAAMTGTGQLPKLEEDMYVTADEDLFLIPTAEVPVTNLHREETLAEAELPLRYCAFSPCFRREAGAAGKDTRGLLRVHQFHKVELVKFVPPASSWDELESLTADAEALLQGLELPYRVALLAAGDLSFAAAKCYDLEVWSPGVEGSRCPLVATSWIFKRVGLASASRDPPGAVSSIRSTARLWRCRGSWSPSWRTIRPPTGASAFQHYYGHIWTIASFSSRTA
jgi:seryl-tRNA synthetase